MCDGELQKNWLGSGVRLTLAIGFKWVAVMLRLSVLRSIALHSLVRYAMTRYR